MAKSVEERKRLLEENAELVERLIRSVSKKRLQPDEVKEFAGWVRRHLVNHDYALLRDFEGRTSFRTYLTTVIRRLLSDYEADRRLPGLPMPIVAEALAVYPNVTSTEVRMIYEPDEAPLFALALEQIKNLQRDVRQMQRRLDETLAGFKASEPCSLQ